MRRPRIVITDHAFGDVAYERALAEECSADLAVLQCRSEAETIDAVRGADVVLVNFAPVSRAVISGLAPGATVIRYGIGFDNVDIDAAREAGVRVCNVPDYGADTVADHAVACLLALLRRLGEYTGRLRREGWFAASALGDVRGLGETTVGLVGTGRIGRAVAARLAPFGCRVVAHDPYVDGAALRGTGIEPVSWDALLAESHAISLHAPLTAQSRHLMDARSISRMRRGAVLVNTSRGGLVDEGAVAQALGDGRLGGAALDVFDPEPLDERSPLRAFENVILTPHAAFYSTTSLDALPRLAADEARRALRGEALRCRIV